jgi:hypothetical protein
VGFPFDYYLLLSYNVYGKSETIQTRSNKEIGGKHCTSPLLQNDKSLVYFYPFSYKVR